MADNCNGYSVEELVNGLEGARGDDAGIVAVLWTWLDSHLLTLGSLEEKPPEIRRAAADRAARSELYEGLTDEILDDLKARPLRNAAELLAWIDCSIDTSNYNLVQSKQGLGGTEVIVTVREPGLATEMGAGDTPPTSIEHPSLLTLTRWLVVSPLEMNGIQLQIEEPEDLEWERLLARIEQTRERPYQSLCVHLDTLGEHGLDGWDPAADRRVGVYNAQKLTGDALEECEDAAGEAVKRACGPLSVLVMPELAATPPVLERISKELRDQKDSPILTVIGAYHCVPEDSASVDPELLGDSKLAQHVNEAVAFGPDGGELWRQRKMSCAAGGTTKDEEGFVESIRLGNKLTLVPTPLGTVVIVICLDAFAPHVRERLAMSPAETLLVPSLSPSVRRHRESLQQLVHVLWGSAFVCNRSPYGEKSPFNPHKRSVWNDDRNRSFWVPQDYPPDAPEQKPPGAYPSFVFSLNTDPPKGSEAGVDAFT